MSLLESPLLVLLGVLAVALPLITPWWWSRITGPRPVRGLAPLSLVGASQVAAVPFVAAALNDYGYFYGSWSELSGQGSPVREPTSAPPGRPLVADGIGDNPGPEPVPRQRQDPLPAGSCAHWLTLGGPPGRSGPAVAGSSQ